MRNLLGLIVRLDFFFFFLLLEGFAVIMVVQRNNFHQAKFINTSRTVEGIFSEASGRIKEYISLRQTNEELYR